MAEEQKPAPDPAQESKQKANSGDMNDMMREQLGKPSALNASLPEDANMNDLIRGTFRPKTDNAA